MNLSKKFTQYIKSDKDFQLAYNIIKQNSHGKIWLIGGGLSRNLSSISYGGNKENHDFDFIVEKEVKKFKLPKEWKIKKNKYGNPKFIQSAMSIDYIPLKTIHSIKRRRLKPTIKNFLIGTPFTIQSMAYDIKKEKIIGRKGIKALKKKIFEINDKEQSQICANKKGISVKELITKKAKSMNFKPIF